MGGRFNLVDMPGYGYAKANPAKIQAWTELIEFYLQERRTLRRLCLLIDARHGIMDADKEFMDKLSTYAVPFVAALTKTDKIVEKEVAACRAQVETTLKKWGGAWPTAFPVSAEKEKGLEELRLFLAQSVV
ncbi:MAG: hypothetical protein HY053_04180 [Proteobacteria bacterium]|nr:hypothetical protein [Pseudomonadota bacterium]